MFSEQYDKMAHDAVASIVRQAALDEWEFKSADLRDFPTGTAHDRDKFLDGLRYGLECLVMRVTGEDFSVTD